MVKHSLLERGAKAPFVEAVDISEIDEFKDILEADSGSLVKGSLYTLKGMECDGFSMPVHTYEVKGVIGDFHGINVDSVIVKQVDEPSGPIYTLSKHDCAELGIPYESGLQLFPRGMPFEIAGKPRPKFEKENLSTYPTSTSDGLIHHILIKAYGFADYADGYVMTPSGRLVDEKELPQRIYVYNKNVIVFDDSQCHLNENCLVHSSVVMPKADGIIFKYGNCIADDASVYILVSFKRGIDPRFIDGFSCDSLFSVICDDEWCIHVKAYEKLGGKVPVTPRNSFSDIFDAQMANLANLISILH